MNNQPDSEFWKPVVGYEFDYEVSSLGRLRRCSLDPMGRATNLNKIIKPMNGSRGYYINSLWKDRRPHSKLVHKLVAEAFFGPANGLYVNHKNGVKTDNRLDNLEYVTQSENYRHALSVLGFKPPSGEIHHTVWFNDDVVVEIARRARSGEKQADLGREFGVSPSVVSNYANGKSRAKALMPRILAAA